LSGCQRVRALSAIVCTLNTPRTHRCNGTINLELKRGLEPASEPQSCAGIQKVVRCVPFLNAPIQQSIQSDVSNQPPGLGRRKRDAPYSCSASDRHRDPQVPGKARRHDSVLLACEGNLRVPIGPNLTEARTLQPASCISCEPLQGREPLESFWLACENSRCRLTRAPLDSRRQPIAFFP
jgi:hypothetical protein